MKGGNWDYEDRLCFRSFVCLVNVSCSQAHADWVTAVHARGKTRQEALANAKHYAQGFDMSTFGTVFCDENPAHTEQWYCVVNVNVAGGYFGLRNYARSLSGSGATRAEAIGDAQDSAHGFNPYIAEWGSPDCEEFPNLIPRWKCTVDIQVHTPQ